MAIINALIFIVLIALAAILVFGTRIKGITTVATVLLIGVITSITAVRALLGSGYETVLTGTELFGPVPLRVDALSAWFILTINFTMATGSVYGFNYMKQYSENSRSITLHCIAFLLLYTSLIAISTVQNSFIFLLMWEVLAISVSLLVIFEYEKPDTISAGLNSLVQSHVSIVFLMLGFIYAAIQTGSFDFNALSTLAGQQASGTGIILFLTFFAGFAIKAGFVPFHTWLPYAHPAAPSHVSGIMSGVVIKIGIYGILRMIMLIKTDYLVVGYIILILSLFTGVYGVILATIQHNLKKLLAYHSIENIGIIGMGVGLGCIGSATGNRVLALLGFGGALLHTLNHSLFKSLLFYGAGNVLQACHTMNIDSLGGLVRRMPQTAFLFLAAAIAICGLPPLNGFISEFLIYGGLYSWLNTASLVSLITILVAIGGLVFIGGLAILCFSKAFSIVFLGTPRTALSPEPLERGFWQLFPMYLTSLFMIVIGLFPAFFLNALRLPVSLLSGVEYSRINEIKTGFVESLGVINWLFAGFIFLVGLLILIRKLLPQSSNVRSEETWGCGYNGNTGKMQYTAGSYVRSYSKLAKPFLDIEKDEVGITEIFPTVKVYKTHSYDKIERYLIDKPVRFINRVTDLFAFLQNGRLQRYILYGIVFIGLALALPFIIMKMSDIISFLNNK